MARARPAPSSRSPARWSIPSASGSSRMATTPPDPDDARCRGRGPTRQFRRRRSGHPAPPAVINATGVIVHTNLGRAPWPAAAAEAVADLATRYQLLELDRATGRRGQRARIAEDHLVALTGAEDALVTNNNAAALALAVGLAGRGRGIVVSRGELVEIGGGVRIPDIIRRAGAKLIEVGTTNRTRAADFEEPLAAGRAGAVLRVHPSNFTMSGFTETPDPSRGRGPGPRARRDRHRRPWLGGAPRHGRLRADPRAAPRRAPGRRLGRRHVQRRQAGRRAAGGSRRGSRGPRRRGCGAIRWLARCGRTRSRWQGSR